MKDLENTKDAPQSKLVLAVKFALACMICVGVGVGVISLFR